MSPLSWVHTSSPKPYVQANALLALSSPHVPTTLALTVVFGCSFPFCFLMLNPCKGWNRIDNFVDGGILWTIFTFHSYFNWFFIIVFSMFTKVGMGTLFECCKLHSVHCIHFTLVTLFHIVLSFTIVAYLSL